MKTESTNALTSRTNSPLFGRVSIAALTACVGLLSGIANGADRSPALSIADSSSKRTTATLTTEAGLTEHYRVTNNVIVKIDDSDYLEQFVSLINSRIPGTQLSEPLNDAGTVFAISAPTVGDASRIVDILGQSSVVQSVTLDMKKYLPERERLSREFRAQTNIKRAQRQQYTQALGIAQIDDTQTPRGGTDPLLPALWYFDNQVKVQHDNNIPSSVYDITGITGSGINVGISTFRVNDHLDVDQPDLVNTYDSTLSQVFDPVLYADDTLLTAAAGLINAERGNGLFGQGIAPGARLGTFNFEFTDFTAFEGFAWLNDKIDIKVYRPTDQFLIPGGEYTASRVSSYVNDALRNSIRSGRNNKGVVNIFGTNGLALPFPRMPIPDTFTQSDIDGFFPTDDWIANGTEVSHGVDFGYTSGPFYPPAQTNLYPMAANRRSLVIGSVDENGLYDTFGGVGTNIFASVWAANSNASEGSNDALPVLSTFPGPDPSAAAVYDRNESGPVLAAGIVALLLEANPNLSVRDIHHVLFRSIQESEKLPEHIWPNFDAERLYMSSSPNPLASYSFWQANNGLYNSDTVTNQAIRHSDLYGFGMIDTEKAIEIATTYPGSPKLIALDTGIVGDANDGVDRGDDGRVPTPIDNAEFVIFSEADGSTGTDGAAALVPGQAAFFNVCVRQNVTIESIVFEATISGAGSNDLYIEAQSPSGTRSIFAMPTTFNPIGTADDDIAIDDESDQGFSSGTVNGTTYAYYQHPFLSWKHWGELSGGRWTFTAIDFGADEETPEGEAPGTGPMGDPGANTITGLGVWGVPGSQYREEHEFAAFRFIIYGTESGVEIFQGCDPLSTACPGDLDGNGIINIQDLQIYLSWFTNGNAFADLNGDGTINVSDLFTYRGIWDPGFCNGNSAFQGGRPHPGTSDSNGSDNNPVIRPI